ncbi:MAG: HAMP domain-containing protein, partial [Alphaproteobacteria bacterium]|nr:HAMP domain-containing protein [Alphaproteobacteria bacterium]
MSQEVSQDAGNAKKAPAKAAMSVLGRLAELLRFGAFLSRFKIKYQVSALALVGVVALAGVGTFTHLSMSEGIAVVNEFEAAENRAAKVNATQIGMLQLRRNEKDFLLRSSTKYAKRHEKNLAEVYTYLDALNKSGLTPETEAHIQALKPLIDAYGAQFRKVVEMKKTLGLDEKSGLRGNARKSVHDIESALKGVGADNLMVTMLMMRRHEKDFLLRLDKKYVTRMVKRAETFSKRLAASPLPPAKKAEITRHLAAYQSAFAAMAKGYLTLGDNLKLLSASYAKTVPVMEKMVKAFKEQAEAARATLDANGEATKFYTLLAVLVALGFIVLFSYVIGSAISNPLVRLAAGMEKLTHGRTDIEVIGTERRDEIGMVWRALDKLKLAVGENFRIKQMVEEMPINILTCDPHDGTVNYANKTSLETLKRFEERMPVAAEEIVGHGIDFIFEHNKDEHLKRLSSAEDLPHQEVIQLGEDYLDLSVSAITDIDGAYMGPMLSWSVVTDKVKADREAERLLNMIDTMPINVMTLDPGDFTISYANQTSKQTLKPMEHLLPCPAEEVEGQCVDIFHKHPEHQRNLLTNPDNLPHKANIKLGDETLSLEVSAVRDKDGAYICPMMAWSVITDQMAIATRVQDVADAVAASSTQMKATAESMASTAEETNVQASTVAAASEQATNNVQTVASAAEELSSSINEIGEQVSQSTRIAQKAVDETQKTNETVQGLADAAQKIGDVVDLINDIA